MTEATPTLEPKRDARVYGPERTTTEAAERKAIYGRRRSSRPVEGRAAEWNDDPWLAGFIDGEGCFTFSISSGVAYPRFKIGLRWDDREILERLRDAFGGRLYFDDRLSRSQSPYVRPNRGQPRSQPMVHWIIARRVDVERIVSYLDRFPLRAKKVEQFEAWRERFGL